MNTSEDDVTISLTRSDGTLVVGAVDFPNATNYADIAPGTYDLEVRNSQGVVLVFLDDITLSSGVNYSTYYFGSEGTQTQAAFVVADLTTQGQPVVVNP